MDERKDEEIKLFEDEVNRASTIIADMSIATFAKDELSLGAKRKEIEGIAKGVILVSFLKVFVNIAGMKNGRAMSATGKLPEKCEKCGHRTECIAVIGNIDELLRKGDACKMTEN